MPKPLPVALWLGARSKAPTPSPTRCGRQHRLAVGSDPGWPIEVEAIERGLGADAEQGEVAAGAAGAGGVGGAQGVGARSPAAGRPGRRRGERAAAAGRHRIDLDHAPDLGALQVGGQIAGAAGEAVAEGGAALQLEDAGRGGGLRAGPVVTQRARQPVVDHPGDAGVEGGAGLVDPQRRAQGRRRQLAREIGDRLVVDADPSARAGERPGVVARRRRQQRHEGAGQPGVGGGLAAHGVGAGDAAEPAGDGRLGHEGAVGAGGEVGLDGGVLGDDEGALGAPAARPGRPASEPGVVVGDRGQGERGAGGDPGGAGGAAGEGGLGRGHGAGAGAGLDDGQAHAAGIGIGAVADVAAIAGAAGVEAPDRAPAVEPQSAAPDRRHEHAPDHERGWRRHDPKVVARRAAQMTAGLRAAVLPLLR
ncbi:MAG: hypothetical protein R2939_02825 [Kofleriaceae bacterium]